MAKPKPAREVKQPAISAIAAPALKATDRMASYAVGSAVWPPEIRDIPLDEIGTTGFGLAAAVDVALVGGYPQSLRRQRHSKHCCRSAGTAVLCQVDGPSGLTDIKARGRDPAYF